MTPCHMCKYKSRLWGMEYCLLAQWAGKDFEKRCSEYTRAEYIVIHWHNAEITGLAPEKEQK